MTMQTSELPATKARAQMPPVRKPREPKNDAPQWAMLMAQNLDAHARWLRRGEVGHELPHNVQQEITFSKISDHLILAIEGKHWVAPQE